jgi:hypothetical protein
VLIFIVGLVLAGLFVPAINCPGEQARMMQASSNARQIIITLKNYAGDHNGRYPEGKTSNEVFRELFKAGLLEDERAFTAWLSPYEPDNNIGEAPNYEEALKPGENHWAMTRGLNDSSLGEAPLIFENPAVASWPPSWNANAVEKKEPGRTWKGGKIIIGRNDGSIAGEPLEGTTGMVTMKPNADGKNLFEAIGPHEVIDIARPAK